MLKGNKIFLTGIICLLSIFLAACMPLKPTREEIVGLWVERRETSRSGSSMACGSFEFFPDGRFEARNIQREYFILRGISPTRISAPGSWQLDTSSKDPFAFHRVDLTFGPVQGFPLGFDSGMLISTNGRELILFAGLPDDSNRITFVKRNKAECE